MSIHNDYMKRPLVPFDYARARYESNALESVADGWPSFLSMWARMNADAAEAFISEAKSRREAFTAARAATQEAP